MANIMSLNLTDHPTLKQFVVNTPTGLFDFLAQQSGGSVTVTNRLAKKEILAMLHPTTGKAFIKET